MNANSFHPILTLQVITFIQVIMIIEVISVIRMDQC